MRRYLNVAKGQYLTFAVYRFALIFTFIGNVAYVAVVYFLWRSIYADETILRGMTFNQVFVYLTLAASIFILFNTYTDWQVSHKIIQGDIVMDLIKPLDFQLLTLGESLGFMAFNGLIISIPSLVVLFLVFGASIPVGINLLFFPLSICCAYALSFMLDYTVGLTSFYTESLWGIAMTKEVIVTTLSGALIPLQFFPDGLRDVLELLPFQAIYHIPLQIATNPALGTGDYLRYMGIQALWIGAFVLGSRLSYRMAIRVLVINGG